MKKMTKMFSTALLATMAAFASIAQAASFENYNFYVAPHYTNTGNSDNSSIDSDIGSGASFGVTRYFGKSGVFGRAEMVGFSRSFAPALGVGFDFGPVNVTVGGGLASEEATYDFGSGYTKGYDSNDFQYTYADLEVGNFFARYMAYSVDHAFSGLEIGSNPAVTRSASTSADNSAVMAGYRIKF